MACLSFSRCQWLAYVITYSLHLPSTLFSALWDTHLRQLEALTNLLSENRIVETNGVKMLVYMLTCELPGPPQFKSRLYGQMWQCNQESLGEIPQRVETRCSRSDSA